MVVTYTLKKTEIERLIKEYATGLVRERDIPYAKSYTIASDSDKVILNVYSKVVNNAYKVVVQGVKTDLFKQVTKYISSMLSKTLNATIGSDESGKGDLFGPLVIACIYVNRNSVKSLVESGVRDSKKLSDKRIVQIYEGCLSNLDKEIVIISPSKYNELYSSIQNVNKLLAWGHSKAIHNLLKRHKDNCKKIIVDKFSSYDGRLGYYFRDLPSQYEFVQIHKGEQFLPVAAASIVARYFFVKGIQRLKEKYKMAFPLGVNNKVKKVRCDFIDKYGGERLKEVAKISFKLK